MRDAEKMVAWVREAADELEKAHRILDDEGVPRERTTPGALVETVPMTLAARIATALDEAKS